MTEEAQPGRDEKGLFAPGNVVARTHGVRAFEDRGAITLPEQLRSEMEGFAEQLALDQGGADQLTTVRAGYMRRLVELETIIRLLWQDLMDRGFYTCGGNLRASYKHILTAMDRWDRMAKQLGMKRRPKELDPIKAIEAAVERAKNEPR